jgi:hypothetical protein
MSRPFEPALRESLCLATTYAPLSWFDLYDNHLNIQEMQDEILEKLAKEEVQSFYIVFHHLAGGSFGVFT